MNMQQAIAAVTDRQDLSQAQMQAVMNLIMTGEATQAQVGGFLVGLRMKGETVDEITGAVMAMRALAAGVEVKGEHIIDTCGTGGDSSGIFNVSTGCAFIASAAGAQVAKHGNRSISSKSGSSDLLEAAGVDIMLKPFQVELCIAQLGVGFMFAPAHHSAMKHAIGPRREMAIRTLFNILGPLTNPAGAPHQVLGVFSRQWQRPMAQVLRRLGSKHVMVVHSEDGLDEISIAAPTYVVELNNGEITEYTIDPTDYNLSHKSLDALVVDDAIGSLKLIKQAFAGEVGAPLDMLLLNAGAAIYSADLAIDLAAGIEQARAAISSGAAQQKLEDLIQLTQGFNS
ncbi:anthranilate phosphoribosyltransferase [Candidatus Njordibacter sp. Uisw_056]|jgi:anthranilate phosphoribosyltransferase|uniref:anthranilate phosphoribosyltransferase n=1 Tax=Candidatus Njordibacter sp. Uisw_056 TaxID=3230973 RepID=UPI003D426E4E|tara:strand:- start:849 stop:1871 length:1023 start_codon:yes stop_codon:yes gene_type:complete